MILRYCKDSSLSTFRLEIGLVPLVNGNVQVVVIILPVSVDVVERPTPAAKVQTRIILHDELEVEVFHRTLEERTAKSLGSLVVFFDDVLDHVLVTRQSRIDFLNQLLDADVDCGDMATETGTIGDGEEDSGHVTDRMTQTMVSKIPIMIPANREEFELETTKELSIHSLTFSDKTP